MRRFCRKDGSPLWCLVLASTLFDAESELQGSFDMLTDITAHKMARQELELKNQELKVVNEPMAGVFVELKSTEEMQ